MATAIDRLIELDEQETAKQKEQMAWLGMMDAVVEALPDALIATDSAGKIFLFNERAELMFGLHRSELIGETVERLLPERCRDDHVHLRETYSRFEISQRSRTMGVGMDLFGLRSDGCEFPVEITLARMVVPKGVFNLALVRYSPRAAGLAAVTPSPLQPEPVAAISPEDSDAEH